MQVHFFRATASTPSLGPLTAEISRRTTAWMFALVLETANAAQALAQIESTHTFETSRNRPTVMPSWHQVRLLHGGSIKRCRIHVTMGCIRLAG